MGGDIRSSIPTPGKYGEACPMPSSSRGYIRRFGYSKKTYKCNKNCLCLDNPPHCECAHDILETYFKKYGRFRIEEGKYGEGCPIYLAALKGELILGRRPE